MNNIELFCTTPSKHNYQKLSPIEKELFVKISFELLNQKEHNIKEVTEKILIAAGELIQLYDYNIYTNHTDDPLEQLTRYGVVIVPIIHSDNLSDYRNLFDREMLKFPEYNGKPDLYTLGGFGALGNPGSFHNELVRELRILARKKIEPFFRRYIDNYNDEELRNNYKLETLIDRMMTRNKGQAASAESWHRDVMPPNRIPDTDEIFGGWLNLDNEDQYFSCIPGSHLGIFPNKISSGFATMHSNQKKKIMKENPNITNKELEAEIKSRMKEVSKHKTKFVIPPGHMIIFPQYILHEVISSKAKQKMYRLFTGWRLTESDNSIMDYEDILGNQGIVPLPGGMKPPMYSKNHGSSFLGIPIVKKIPKKFDIKKWAKKQADYFFQFYPSSDMTKRYQLVQDILASEESGRYVNILHDEKILRELIGHMAVEYSQSCRYNLGGNNELKTIEDKVIGTYKIGTNEFINIKASDYLKDNTLYVSLNPFRTIPGDDKSITTLIEWSLDTFNDNILETKIYKKNKGTYRTVAQHLKSLKSYDLPLYPEYSEEEKDYYQPGEI
jgi:hypothetical protein